MAVPYIKDHIPSSTARNRRPGLILAPRFITIHNTANEKSTARNERAWLVNPSNTATASYHIVIDDREAIECIPTNEVSWHAGDGSGSNSGNRTSISIEICESGRYERTLENASDLVAAMLKERGWGVEALRRHHDWSGKICPRLMYDNGTWKGWYNFKDNVAAKLAVLNKQEETDMETRPAQPDPDPGEGGEQMLSAEDANKIILFLSAAYMSTEVAEARKEYNRLANELRKASGQLPQ